MTTQDAGMTSQGGTSAAGQVRIHTAKSSKSRDVVSFQGSSVRNGYRLERIAMEASQMSGNSYEFTDVTPNQGQVQHVEETYGYGHLRANMGIEGQNST
ncbi:hypothetical protein TNCV_4952241 [Trichonephila clavipes]|nr:hypothetical protein TNCV_4952241 [Trichonephila clavipes]